MKSTSHRALRSEARQGKARYRSPGTLPCPVAGRGTVVLGSPSPAGPGLGAWGRRHACLGLWPSAYPILCCALSGTQYSVPCSPGLFSRLPSGGHLAMVPPAPGVFPLGNQPRAGQNPPDGQTARRRRLKEERTGTSPAGVEVRAGRYPGMPGTWLALHRRVGWPALPPIFHPPPLVGFAGVGARRLALATGSRRLAPGGGGPECAKATRGGTSLEGAQGCSSKSRFREGSTAHGPWASWPCREGGCL